MNKKENTPGKKKTHQPNTPPIIKRRLYTKNDTNLGAPSKFDLVNEEIIDRTRCGASKKDRIGGLIHDVTYNEWLSAGDEDLKNEINSQFSKFSLNIRAAENEYRVKLRKLIEQHAENDHRAATWLLERSDPDTYKLRDKMDVKQEIEVSQKAILEIPDNGRRSVKVSNDRESS